MRLSTEQRFAFWLVSATVLRGWALAEQGQGAEGIAQIRQGLAAWQAMGAELSARFRCPPGRGLWESRADRGRAHRAGRGARVKYQHAEGCVRGRAVSAQGELLQQSAGPREEAEACFHQALDIARRQQAKSWELRAAMSLAACGSSRANGPRP